MCFCLWSRSFQHGAYVVFLPSFLPSLKSPILVEKLNTLPSQKCVVYKNRQATCRFRQIVDVILLVRNGQHCRRNAPVGKKKERHLVRCLLGYVVFHGQVRICGIMQPQGRCHSRLCCTPLTSLLHQDRSLSSSSLQASTLFEIIQCIQITDSQQIFYLILSSSGRRR